MLARSPPEAVSTAGIYALRQLATAALAVATLFSAILLLLPHLDVTVAGLFYGDDHQFIGNRIAVFNWIRQAFKGLFIVFCAATIAGLVMTRSRSRTWLGIRFVQWLFLLICLVTGPGIVANLGLKDHWGRARPSQIVEFGGTKSFTPALKPALKPAVQCDRNCSFVSGEASSIFALFFAIAFVFRGRSAALLAFGIAAGSIAGLVRMSQGGHFLSDVVFAGVLMALTTVVVNFVFEAVAEASGVQNGEVSGAQPVTAFNN